MATSSSRPSRAVVAARSRRPRLTAVFGGGGLFGIAFILGVADGLSARGTDLRGVDTVGTSAGSWAAAGINLGVRFLDALEAVGHRAPRRPSLRRGHLRSVARDLFGDDARCAELRGVACALPRLGRCVLHAGEHPVADVVAASSSVPGLVPPHGVGRSWYVDGGVRSMASLDLAPAADTLLAVLPLGAPTFGRAGALLEHRTAWELGRWHRSSPGGRSIVVRPTCEIASLVGHPGHLFDPERARPCYDLARELGERTHDELRRAGATSEPRRPARQDYAASSASI